MVSAECKRAQSRAYCYAEAADHLTVQWSDSEIELFDVNFVEDALRKKSDYWFNRAADLADA